MAKLDEMICEFLSERGALAVGFANKETLAGGPPSADITYVLKEARSAISFALPLDRDIIRACLSKKSQFAFEQHNIEVNTKATAIAKELAQHLEKMGHASKRVVANNRYRKDVEAWQVKMHPDVSHRYVAARSGVGSYGWSGNVGMKNYGTAIILSTVVTAADLEPTEPIPDSENFCDDCKLCVAGCASGMIEMTKEMTVTLGGKTFKHAARKNLSRCHLVCGGFSGLHKSGKWSTWSPGRYVIPEDDEELQKTFWKALGNYAKWPKRGDGDGGYSQSALGGMNVRLTCGNCQILCVGDKNETKANYKALTTSGCVIQRPNGEIVVLSHDEAAAEFDKMEPGHKNLYR